MNNILWESPFRSTQVKLEDWSNEFDWWLDYYMYNYNYLHLVSHDLASLDNELTYVVDNIDYYKDSDEKSNINNILLNIEINRYNDLVLWFNSIKPWWITKKEYYNNGV